MSRRILLLAAWLAFGALPPAAGATPPEEIELLLGTIRANREALIEVNLGLDPEERARFQPVYESYQKEIGGVQERVFGVLEEYVGSFDTLSDDQAKSLIERFLAAEEDRARIRHAYLPKFEAVLPGRKVARFYQIENKMDAVLRYELAARIPVVGK